MEGDYSDVAIEKVVFCAIELTWADAPALIYTWAVLLCFALLTYTVARRIIVQEYAAGGWGGAS